MGRDDEADEVDDDEDLIGFTVQDPDGTVIGTVTDYEDIPGNTCLWVKRPDGAEVLLPFHEDLVVGLSSSVLTLRIPDGILDM